MRSEKLQGERLTPPESGRPRGLAQRHALYAAMPRAQPLDPDARRAQLLDVARLVFARQGYHATSVADLIAAAGVARGTFYNYFESKRAVFQAVLDALMDDLGQCISAIDPTGDIAGQLRDNLARIMGVLLAQEDLARLLFADAVGLDEEGDDALRAFYGAAKARIFRALQTGQLIGIVRAGDVGLMARCLLGAVKEPIFQAWLEGVALDGDGLVEELLRLVMVGVMAPAGEQAGGR